MERISNRLQDTPFHYATAPSVISENPFTDPSRIHNSFNKPNLIKSHVSK